MNTAVQTAALPNPVTQTPRREQRIIPPETVPIAFNIASMGSRLGAQTLDILFSYGATFLIAFLLIWMHLLSWTALSTLLILLMFLVRIPYYIFSELIWNGRTLGKRITGVRVIDVNGRRLTPHQITARNLMKEVEIFLPISLALSSVFSSVLGSLLTWVWIIGVAIVPFANRRRQRLGDIIAGTLVVENPRAVLLPDLMLTTPAGAQLAAQQTAFNFEPRHLDFYGRYELQTLENVLRDPANQQTDDNGEIRPASAEITKIVRAIIRRTGYDGTVKYDEEFAFLTAFYRAQRDHLETLRLFGKQREDKHHLTSAEMDIPMPVATGAMGLSFRFEQRHLEVYGHYEMQTLENILRDPARIENSEEIEQIARTIIKKIDYAPTVDTGYALTFLRAFYWALREHTEQEV